MSHLGFKARVNSLICALQRHTCYTFPKFNLWCNTCWPLGSQHDSHSFPCTWDLLCCFQPYSMRPGRWSTDWAMLARIICVQGLGSTILGCHTGHPEVNMCNPGHMSPEVRDRDGCNLRSFMPHWFCPMRFSSHMNLLTSQYCYKHLCKYILSFIDFIRHNLLNYLIN